MGAGHPIGANLSFLEEIRNYIFVQVTYGSFEFVLQTNESAGRTQFFQ